MRKQKKTVMAVEELLNDPEKKLEEASSNVPATIWRSQLMQLGVTPMMFTKRLEAWLLKQRKAGEQGKSLSTSRSNEIGAITKPYMTWKQMMKSFRILGFKEIHISFTVVGKDDKVTRTNITVSGDEDDD